MFELPQSIADKSIAEVTPRGVAYTLRSVREALVASVAHFTVYKYTPSWVFLCLFFSLAVVGQNIEQADEAPTFFVCS